MEFKVGMKVVCVVEFSIIQKAVYPDATFPNKGQVVTIRNMMIDEVGDTFLRFDEIKNPVKEYKEGVGEIQFWSKHFVPLLSDFKRMTFKEVTELVEVGEN